MSGAQRRGFVVVQFVDEIKIRVQGGRGGDGCVSFRREKYIPFGGPNGGDGGEGGSVYLIADDRYATLSGLRYNKLYKAGNGQHGSSQDKTGRQGERVDVFVPPGTRVKHPETGEIIADLVRHGQTFCIAKGGTAGLGNVHFKSSKNRAPRQRTEGGLGDEHVLILSLQVLADVGLLGYPNAGKSSLIRVVSQATPKVADYPFTTLRPHLGVVEVDPTCSFVMADIPGLIAGAASGMGLGTFFLKHLSRCRLLLHVVSLEDQDQSYEAQVRAIVKELADFDAALQEKPRWLVFSKSDLFEDHVVQGLVDNTVKALGWQGPVFVISAIAKRGLTPLIHALGDFFTAETSSSAATDE